MLWYASFVMSLVLIVGPMKSGKSTELISRVSIYTHSDLRALWVQSALNVRDNGIWSRLGVEIDAEKVDSLKYIDAEGFDVIAVDEIFMFPPEDMKVLNKWLKLGKDVIVSSLDLSAMGRIPETLAEIYKLGPDEIVKKTAVCESCRAIGAQFTQILEGSEPAKDLPDVVPEDGTYEYRPVCRACFFA